MSSLDLLKRYRTGLVTSFASYWVHMYKLPLCTWVRMLPRKKCEKRRSRTQCIDSEWREKSRTQDKIVFWVFIVEASTKKLMIIIIMKTTIKVIKPTFLRVHNLVSSFCFSRVTGQSAENLVQSCVRKKAENSSFKIQRDQCNSWSLDSRLK